MPLSIDEFLGVDFGSAKVGIARGSTRARLAEPLKSVDSEKAIETLIELAKNNQAGGVVVGLPRGLDGQDTGQTLAVKKWAGQAKHQLGLPCFWQDEALTSKGAAEAQSKDKKYDEHSLAAAIILQDFLNTPDNNRVEV